MSLREYSKILYCSFYGAWLFAFTSLGVYVNNMIILQSNYLQVSAMLISILTLCVMPYKILSDMKEFLLGK